MKKAIYSIYPNFSAPTAGLAAVCLPDDV